MAGSHDDWEKQLDQLDKQLRVSVEALRHPSPPSIPAEEVDDVLLANKHQMERRASRGFTRYLVALCIGVAVILAWLSYGDATKQIIATKASELGWSPEAKQRIASWVQRLGWTKPPPVETKAAPVTQTAPETVAAKQPTTAPDPQQIQQIEAGTAAVRQAVEGQLADVRASVEQLAASQDEMARVIEKLQAAERQLADVRATVEQLAGSQDKMAREIEKLQAANEEILEKIPPPPPKRPAAPTRKPIPTASAAPTRKPIPTASAAPARKPIPTARSSSRAPIPPHLPPHP
jgi:hypothetical protein